MALSLQESFNNIVLIANAALLDKAQRVGIDESLNKIANALQQYEIMTKSPEKIEPEGEPDESVD